MVTASLPQTPFKCLNKSNNVFYCYAVQRQITYEVLGCYKDNQVDPRPLPELLADLTGEVDWYDPSKVIKKCAKLASDKGYTVFGLQSIGHCRSGKNAAETYNSDGESPGCKSGLGGKGENLVFKITPQSRFLTSNQNQERNVMIKIKC